MFNPMQQNNPAPRPVTKCEHCGSESGPHYDAHKINNQTQTIEPEPKNICHTCFHKNAGQFMHHAEFVKIQEAKQVQHAAAHHQQHEMSVSAAAPLVHQSAATQDEEEEEEEEEQEQDQEPAQETKRRGRRPATR